MDQRKVFRGCRTSGLAGLGCVSFLQKDVFVSFLAAVRKGFLRAWGPSGQLLVSLQPLQRVGSSLLRWQIGKGMQWTSQLLKGLFSHFPLPLCV